MPRSYTLGILCRPWLRKWQCFLRCDETKSYKILPEMDGAERADPAGTLTRPDSWGVFVAVVTSQDKGLHHTHEWSDPPARARAPGSIQLGTRKIFDPPRYALSLRFLALVSAPDGVFRYYCTLRQIARQLPVKKDSSITTVSDTPFIPRFRPLKRETAAACRHPRSALPIPRINNKCRQDCISLVNFGELYECWAFLRATTYCRGGDW
jgi:hypothetical protein